MNSEILRTSTDTKANTFHGHLRLRGEDSNIGPLRPAKSADATMIQHIANTLASGMADTRTLVLTTGLGIPRDFALPIRLPAVLLPGLRVLERFRSSDRIPPTYLVYQATDFIAESNALDADASKEYAHKVTTYIRAYIDRFHAQIANRVHLKIGYPFPTDHRNAIENVMSILRDEISHCDCLREALAKTAKSEKRHSNDREQYAYYAAANAVYSGASDVYPFLDNAREATHILPIGGTAEQPFFTITSHLSMMQSSRTVIPMLTTLGERPTYYAYPSLSDPMTVEEYSKALNGGVRDGPLRKDLAALVADGAIPEHLADIFPKQS